MSGKATAFVLSAVAVGFLVSQFDHKPLDDCNHESGVYISGACLEKEVV
jgi:hypothetical protein